LCWRKGELNDGPIARRRNDGERTSIRLCEGLGKRQAKAGSLLAVNDGAAGLPEGGKGARQIFVRHANAGILNSDHKIAILRQGRHHTHLAAGARELDRVGEEVEQNLCEAALIGDETRQVLIDLRAN